MVGMVYGAHHHTISIFKDAQAWALNSHFLPNCPETPGWEEWWYWLGLVPLSQRLDEQTPHNPIPN